LSPDSKRADGRTSSRRRRGTKTSAFGSPGRISHQSAAFYGGRLYEGLPKEEEVSYVENQVPAEFLDKIICRSSERMEELPDSSIHLMVTSPPYNVGKEYDRNLTLEEYLGFLERVWSEVRRVLVPGGRCCINVANLGRRPYIPLHSFIIRDMVKLGFLMRGEVIWAKDSSSSPSTAWGSWMSATNPTLRDTHEYILVFSKSGFSRESGGRVPRVHQERLEVRCRASEDGRASGTIPGRVAASLHPAVHLRG
jgi:site-specific DNA-methyltransferase (adenine-specific)